MDIKDVNNIQHEKNKQRLALYKKLSKKCFRRIENCVVSGEAFCLYQIEAFHLGFPLYNMTQFITYLIKILNHKGFTTKYIQPNIVFISWGFGGS